MKIFFILVKLLLGVTIFIPQINLGMPSPWKMIVNENLGQCAHLEYEFCEMPSGWEETQHHTENDICPENYEDMGPISHNNHCSLPPSPPPAPAPEINPERTSNVMHLEKTEKKLKNKLKGPLYVVSGALSLIALKCMVQCKKTGVCVVSVGGLTLNCWMWGGLAAGSLTMVQRIKDKTQEIINVKNKLKGLPNCKADPTSEECKDFCNKSPHSEGCQCALDPDSKDCELEKCFETSTPPYEECKDLICKLYPDSPICEPDVCDETPESVECSDACKADLNSKECQLAQCEAEPGSAACEICKILPAPPVPPCSESDDGGDPCKDPHSIKCKCKDPSSAKCPKPCKKDLNSMKCLLKQCKIDPKSEACKICKILPDSVECVCKTNPKAKKCVLAACGENRNSAKCKAACKKYPLAPECLPEECKTKPWSLTCKCAKSPKLKGCSLADDCKNPHSVECKKAICREYPKQKGCNDISVPCKGQNKALCDKFNKLVNTCANQGGESCSTVTLMAPFKPPGGWPKGQSPSDASLDNLTPDELEQVNQLLSNQLKKAGMDDTTAGSFSKGFSSPSSSGSGGSSSSSGEGMSGFGGRDPSGTFAGGTSSEGGAFEDLGDSLGEGSPGGGGNQGGLAGQTRRLLNNYGGKKKGKNNATPRPKSVFVGRDPVGAISDNIFMMVHRRYRDLDSKAYFIK